MNAVVDIDALITRLRSRASGWYEDLMLEAADALKAMQAETAAITELRGANAEIDMLRHDLAAERARADRLAAGGDQLAEALEGYMGSARTHSVPADKLTDYFVRKDEARTSLASWRRERVGEPT